MPKKKTTQQFIKEAKLIHGDKYDYSKVNYINTHTKITIICKKHGEFEQTPYGHINKKQNCSKCTGHYKPNTEEFIEKAEIIHNNKYDYSKVKYKNCKETIIIICKKHGEFKQKPSCHMNGNGCSKCGYINNGTKSKKSNLQFIKEAILIHGDKYNYSKVNYVSSKLSVIIICKDHGEFKQTPNIHLRGSGCIKCKKTRKSNTKEFLQKAILVHGDKYDYHKVNYINNSTKIKIICKIHGEFEQKPNNHLQKQGCPLCSGNILLSTEEFIQKSILVHKNKYDYSKVNYINTNIKVIIICKKHGEFKQSPDCHTGQKQGCPMCSGNVKLTTEEFIQKAILVHGDKYDYSKVNYINTHTKITIICRKHGEFEQIPKNHCNNHGCPECCNNQYSKISIEWLDFISKKDNILIKHAENHGEYKIPNTRLKADGYCKETNTIYEFHGDYWHGNPKVFEPNEKTYFGKTFKELYKKTIQKEILIKEKGFNLITMWENDWNNINKSIKILQQKFYNSKLH